MDGVGIITVGGVSLLLLEGIKWSIKKIGKKPEFGFPTSFYLVMIPVLNALVPFPLAWLGFNVTAPTLGMTWLEVVKYVILVAIGGLISLLGYNDGVKPLKEDNTLKAALKAGVEVNSFKG